MYLARGNLPWQGMPGKDKDERQRKILEKKKILLLVNYVKVFLKNLNFFVIIVEI